MEMRKAGHKEKKEREEKATRKQTMETSKGKKKQGNKQKCAGLLFTEVLFPLLFPFKPSCPRFHVAWISMTWMTEDLPLLYFHLQFFFK